MALNSDIIEAVANANFKTMAEMQMTNALGHQKRLDMIAEASIGTILERMNTLDVSEAAGVAGVINADLAEVIAQLTSAVANAQQLVKAANSTPPVTP